MESPVGMATFAESWADFMVRGLVDGSVVFAIALFIWLPLRKLAPAHLVYGLFLLVLAKLALPFKVAVPGWLASLSPSYLIGNLMDQWAVEPLFAPVSASIPALGASVQLPPPLGSEVWLLVGWGAVVATLLLRFTLIQVQTRRTVECARPLSGDELFIDLLGLCRAAGISRPVRFFVSDDVASPAAGGLLRPYVLVPHGLVGQLPPRQMSWVLLHELAHIKRGDLWVSLVQRLVQIAFFFHPAVWLANWIIDEQREYACDDAALTWCKARPQECGQGFLSVVEWSHARSSDVAATLGMFGANTVIRRRLMRILDGRRKVSGRGTASSTTFLLAVALLVLPTVTAQDRGPEQERQVADAQDPPQDPPRGRLQTLRSRLERLERENQELRQELEAMRRGSSRGVPSATARRAPAARPDPEARPAPRLQTRPSPTSRPGLPGRQAPRTTPRVSLTPRTAPTPRTPRTPRTAPAPRTPPTPARERRRNEPEREQERGRMDAELRARIEAEMRRVQQEVARVQQEAQVQMRRIQEEMAREMQRVQEEVQRVQQQAQSEVERVQREVQRAQREAETQGRRMQEEAQREMRRVQQEVQRAQQEVQREGRRAQEEAQARAGRAREDTQRDVRRARQQADTDERRVGTGAARRTAEEARREAAREARAEAREARREAAERRAQARRRGRGGGERTDREDPPRRRGRSGGRVIRRDATEEPPVRTGGRVIRSGLGGLRVQFGEGTTVIRTGGTGSRIIRVTPDAQDIRIKVKPVKIEPIRVELKGSTVIRLNPDIKVKPVIITSPVRIDVKVQSDAKPVIVSPKIKKTKADSDTKKIR